MQLAFGEQLFFPQTTFLNSTPRLLEIEIETVFHELYYQKKKKSNKSRENKEVNKGEEIICINLHEASGPEQNARVLR